MRLRALVLLTLLATLAASAQKPAPMELGFAADKVYDFGSIETVNEFNGNLIVRLPIGMRYPVATGFDYGLTLTYNGKIWDYFNAQPTDGPLFQESRPNLRSNAGTGWRVSLGRLLPPSGPTAYMDAPVLWTYESPSGDEHTFSNTKNATAPCGSGDLDPNAQVQFACDGSYLRMVTVNSTTRDVQFPNGRIDEFTNQNGNWLLSQMKDSAGNVVTVGSTFDSNGLVTKCTIVDPSGRTQTIHYRHLPEMGDSVDGGQNVDYIDLAASGTAATVRYTFNYVTVAVPVGPYDDFTGSSFQGAPSCQTTNPCTIAIPLLASIDMPDSQSPTRNHFTFNYFTDASSTATLAQGMLLNLQLPTGGLHEYTYQRYILPPLGPCDFADERSTTPGINTKTVDGHTWTYALAQAGPADLTGDLIPDQCKDSLGNSYPPHFPFRWLRASVISPPDDATGKSTRVDQYFSIFGLPPDGMSDTRLNADGSSCSCTASPYSFGYPGVAGWPGSTQAGLLTPGSPDCGGVDCDARIDDGTNTNTRLSMTSQTYDGCTSAGDCTIGTLLRTTYTRYNRGFQGDLLPIVSERTVFEDDKITCATTCYQQSDKSDFDKAGHFRTAQFSSNYPGTQGDTRHVGYFTLSDSNALSPSFSWLLETYTEKYRVLGSLIDRTQYCFNGAGQMTRTRKLASNDASVGIHDVLTQFVYAGADVSDMMSYGGDYQNIGAVEDICATTLPSQPEYWDHYTYSYGVLKSDQPNTPSGTPMPFLTLDRTIEQNTGLVTASRSTDGLATNYGYEAWGSLKTVTPPGEATTTYTYTPATYAGSTISAYATVVATTADNTNSNYKTVTYSYDGLGRLFKTSRALPGFTCAEQVIGYDSYGRRATESVWKACGGSGANTTTRYDGLGRVLKVTTPDNKVSSVKYTGDRHIERTISVAEKNGEQNVTQGEDYDVFGRLVNVAVPATNPLLAGAYQYDIGDRLSRVDVSASGTQTVQTRTFSYDNRGYLLSETHPELGVSGNGTASYQRLTNGAVDQGYDSRGHSHYKNTGSAFTLFTTFDSAERVLTVTDGSSHVLKQFSYDSTDSTQCPFPTCIGKVSTAVRSNPGYGSIQTTELYRYDSATGKPSRRDTSVSSAGFFTGLSFVFSQQYNAIGELKNVTYPCHTAAPNGSCLDTPLTVGYNYTNGLLSSIDDGSPFPATIWSSGISYQPNGLIADVVHGSNKMHEKWIADAAGMARPGNVVARNGNDTADLWSTGTYQYDAAGNIKAIGNTTYAYDALQQLRTATNVIGTSFNATTTNFDPFGNILSTTQSYCGSNIRCGSSTSLARQVDSAHNHYTDITYDSAGNVTTDGHRTLTYDALGMTSSIAVGDRTFFYLYDADDERVAIVESKGSGYNRTTYTLRGFGNQVLRSYVDNYFSGSESFSRKEDEIWRGDRLLASDNGSVRHYALDQLGSPRFLVDGTGAPLGVGTQTFSPWGVGGTTNGGMLQFTGHERDSVNVADASGYPYAADLPDLFHARLYDPWEARFLSPDPTSKYAPDHPASWNRYEYARNNPLALLDPDGRDDRIGWLVSKFNDVLGHLTNAANAINRAQIFNPSVKLWGKEYGVQIFKVKAKVQVSASVKADKEGVKLAAEVSGKAEIPYLTKAEPKAGVSLPVYADGKVLPDGLHLKPEGSLNASSEETGSGAGINTDGQVTVTVSAGSLSLEMGVDFAAFAEAANEFRATARSLVDTEGWEGNVWIPTGPQPER